MYQAKKTRYDTMQYNRCGNSGLKLPTVSLGLWHNFGDFSSYDNMKNLCFTAFDHGITHFDLANNYGPEPGSAEKHFGLILKEHLFAYRDELLISTKAGYDMWKGPYGNWGSRKYLIASLDQSLQRLGLDYVDIFYHHRMDPGHPWFLPVVFPDPYGDDRRYRHTPVPFFSDSDPDLLLDIFYFPSFHKDHPTYQNRLLYLSTSHRDKLRDPLLGFSQN